MLAVLLVMAVAYVTVSNEVNENETKAAEAKPGGRCARGQAAQLGSFTNFASIKDQRLAVGGDHRRDALRLGAPDARGLACHARGQLAADDPGLGARRPERGRHGPPIRPRRAALSPTATFVGCTPKQSEVAKFMVRLREMHRVTDVKLNESAPGQSDAEATWTAAARSTSST